MTRIATLAITVLLLSCAQALGQDDISTLPRGSHLEMCAPSPSRLSLEGMYLDDEQAASLMGDEQYTTYLKGYERYHDGRVLAFVDAPLIALLGSACLGVAYFDHSYDGSKMLYILGGGCWGVAATAFVWGLVSAHSGLKLATFTLDSHNNREISLNLQPASMTLRF